MVIKLEEKTILQYLLKNDMIDLQNIIQSEEMLKKKEILDNHPYKIWQGKNQKWYTYLPDEEKGRVQKQKTNRGELEDLIVQFYRSKEEDPTIKTLFYEWLDKRIKNQEIEESTYTRYKIDFERLFKEFGRQKIKKVTEADIEDFIKSTVHEKHLTHKAYSNLRTLMYGVFRYAKKKKLIDYSIKEVIDDIDFSKKEFKKIIHEDYEQVFFELDEKHVIEEIEENQDLINLGLLLLFKTGLRVGELSTLKVSDLNGNIIKIRRTETMYQDRETGKFCYDVKEHPKSDAGIRDVIVRDNDLWIIKKIRRINPFGQYLFEQNCERIRAYKFRDRLKTLCKHANTVYKSPHKIRKTYGTKIYDSGILPKSMICKQMGHTDISCLEKYYYYNRKTTAEQIKQINQIEAL